MASPSDIPHSSILKKDKHSHSPPPQPETTTVTPQTLQTTQTTTKEGEVNASLHTCEVANAPQNSFYRRPLPETLVAFSSAEGNISHVFIISFNCL